MSVPCVDMKTLADMINGALDKREKERIMAHIQTCSDCFERVNSALLISSDNELNSYAPLTDKETKSMMKRIRKRTKEPLFNRKRVAQGKRILARVKSWGETMSPDFSTLAYGYARTTAEAEKTPKTEYINEKKSFSDIKTVILFERYEERFNLYIRQADEGLEIKNIRFNLEGKDGQVSRLLKDGYASFDDLAFGKYTLVAMHKQVQKGSFSFEIDQRGLKNG